MFQKKKNKRGEEHGLMNVLPNSSNDTGFKSLNPKIKEKAKALKEEEAKVVKVRYIHHKDQKWGYLYKPYCHWEGQDIQLWKFLSGEEYEVPRGLVNEVNDPIYRGKKLSGLLDVNEKPIPSDEPGEITHEFVSAGF